MFSVVILFRHWFPLLEKAEIQALILPHNLPAVLIIFTGRGRAGNPPFPTVRDGAGNPPLPAGRVPRGAGRPSLRRTHSNVAWTTHPHARVNHPPLKLEPPTKGRLQVLYLLLEGRDLPLQSNDCLPLLLAGSCAQSLWLGNELCGEQV